MTKVYVTREGADRLRKQRDELRQQLKDTQAQKGEAAEVGGNVWHDNFSFEDLSRREDMLNHQLRTIGEVLSSISIVDEKPKDTNRLRIGHVAVLDIDGEEKTFLIGGYGDSDLSTTPAVISYDAPLVRGLIGKGEGDSINVNIGGKRKTIEIIEIQLPDTEG